MRAIATSPARRSLPPLFAGALITMLASQSVLAAVSWTGHIKRIRAAASLARCPGTSMPRTRWSGSRTNRSPR